MSTVAKEIVPINLEDEMTASYTRYAMSVIVSRALPDVRDGLKPVQRRILYAMFEQSMTPDRPREKSAAVVGEVMKKYHPHGNEAIYDALVRMGQDFNSRYLLVDPQGNFGSIDGDPPAAMRYCLTADSLVVTDQGLVPIGNLSNGEENIHIKVLSLGGKVNSASKWFDCGEHPTLKVTTRRGYEIKGTHNHPLLTWQLGPECRPLFAWKTMDKIQPGDWVVLDLSSDVLWQTELVDLRPYHQSLPDGSRAKRHLLPEKLDEGLAFLVGALLAEGTVTRNRVEFTNVTGEFADRFLEVWQAVFPTCRLHCFEKAPASYGKKRFLKMQVVSKQVCGFLHRLGLTPAKSADRSIPELLLRSPKNVVATFLRAYFEGDGAVERCGRSLLCVSACSSSPTLLKQLQVLLLRFGIVSARYADRHRGTQKLVISGQENLRRFAYEIGFVSEQKKKALEEVLAVHSGTALARTDFVPFLAVFVRRLAQRHREWLGKHNFDRYPRLAVALPRLTQALTDNDFELVASVLRHNYLFEQVVAVEDAGIQRVYSIRVDSPCHSFCANGFINHNTEARLTPLAMAMLEDIEKDTVDWRPNYDEKHQEPVVLPAKIPNLLINGSSGIEVAMATNIPPHNLSEVVDAAILLIDEPYASVERLMKELQGPDFPTGGVILGTKGIKEAYETGRGTITIQGRATIEPIEGGRHAIVITELPYQVGKESLIQQIARLVRERRIEGVSNVNDETDKTGMRIVVEVRRDASPKVILNRLLKHTALRTTYGIIMLALVNNEPKVLSIKEMLQHFIEHRRQVIQRRTEHDLKKAEERAHILEGLRIISKNIDEAIALIRRSEDRDDARERLMRRFKLSEAQANAVMDMPLGRLTRLDQENLKNEYQELIKQIEYLKSILRSPRQILEILKNELREVKRQFGDVRRTYVHPEEAEEASIEELIERQDLIITITRDGYIKRLPLDTYRVQKRGGRGVIALTKKEEDFVSHLFVATTHHTILFFTSKGKCYQLKAYEVPVASRQARGTAVINLLQLDPQEHLIATVPVPNFEIGGYLFMATRKGIVKKTELSEFRTRLARGVQAINIAEGDELCWVRWTDGERDILLATELGMVIRFSEKDVRPMGRQAAGVIGIRLREGDRVAAMDVVEPGSEQMLVVTEKGFGKRTPLKQVRAQARGGKGVKLIRVAERNGKVVALRVVPAGDEEVLIITEKGVLIRQRVKEITVHGRAAMGVRLLRLEPGDAVSDVALIVSESTED